MVVVSKHTTLKESLKIIQTFFLLPISFFILFFSTINTRAQDVHFSSFDANPIFYNPALTGFTNNQFRLSTIFRNQWSSVSRGYSSYLLSAEGQLYNNRSKQYGLGLGIIFLADNAGTLNYGQQNIGLSLGFYKSLSRLKEHFISFGLEANNSNWGYDVNNAIFGQEIDDTEGILLHNVKTFDFSFGIQWQLKVDDNNYLQAGASAFHINQPSLSYYEDSDILLPIKFNIYFSDMISFGDNFSLKPTIFFLNQKNFNEFLFGSDFNFDLSTSIIESNILTFGGYYRVLDALVLMIKYQIDSLKLGLSYDINLSRLSPASKTYGGVELWLTYSFNYFKHKRLMTNIPCPTF